MSDPIAAKLADFERRIKELEGRESPEYIPPTAYTVTYVGGATAGATTYSLQNAWYSRHGQRIDFWGRVTWTAATGTGEARILLPLTAGTAASGTYRWSGSLWVNNVTIGTFSPEMLITQATAYFNMWQPANNAGATVIAVEAAGDVIFSGFYHV